MRFLRNVLILSCTLLFLLSCRANRDKRLEQLEMLEHMNRADSVMKNDSLAEDLVNYFNKYGSTNEQMRAYYILGRTYFDLGELPRALETYLIAADCADTTATDCDFRTLSRVYANMGAVFQRQVQPRSCLEVLSYAENYAYRANDTLMAIECNSRKANAYFFLHENDSVITILEKIYNKFMNIGDSKSAARVLSKTIIPLLEKGRIDKAGENLRIYEESSGLVNNEGVVEKGREVYYYIKGKYLLSIGKIDSAEQVFRKELLSTDDINNKIAANKGLHEVFIYKRNTDSIAKYASLGYLLNDSAYSLSEMQNIQKLKLAYEYNHQKLLAEQNKLKAERAINVLLLVALIVVIFGMFFINRYKRLKKIALDYRLKRSPITSRLQSMARNNPPQIPSYSDWAQLRKLVEKEIPSFSKVLNMEDGMMTEINYDVCLLTRVGISPNDISKLKGCSPSHISNIRKRLLLKIYGIEGSSEHFDELIREIH